MIKFDDCITLVSVAHPRTHNLDTGPYSDGGPPSTFGWGWCKVRYLIERLTPVRSFVADVGDRSHVSSSV